MCIARQYSKRLHAHRNPHFVIKYRNFRNFNAKDFLEDLQQTPWNVLDTFDDPDDALDYFTKAFLMVAERHAPQVQKRVRHQKQPPWMTDEILSLIQERDELLRKARQSNNILHWQKYKKSRNTVFKTIRDAKKHYFHDAFEGSSSSKEFWKHLKHVTGAAKRATVSKIRNGDNVTDDPSTIAEVFNKFFVSVASIYKPGVNNSSADNRDILNAFVTERLPADASEFVIPLISQELVFTYLSTIKVGKSTGLDGMSASILRAAAPVIAAPLTKIMNMSINSDKFPTTWKLAKVTPVFKAGDPLNADNYRPISILPIISKILEKHVHVSLYTYLGQYNLINVNQSGFRLFHSCETALIKLVDDLLTNMDNGLISGLTLIDYRKAFDMVDHAILLKKLAMYGVSEKALKWFNSYLSGRIQKVAILDTLSSALPVTMGVPQGSILGPLLFVIFINDLPLYVSKSKIEMYADDSTQVASGNTLDEVQATLTAEFHPVAKWARDNEMVLNCDKMKAMTVCSKPKWRKVNVDNSKDSIEIYIDDAQKLKTVTSTKLLGVYIDSNLTWDIHVDYVKKKVCKRLGLLNRVKEFMTRTARINYYNAVIQPIMDYGSLVWGTTTLANIDTIVRLQKRAARLIMDKRWDTPSQPLFKELDITPFPERVKKAKAKLVYKSLSDKTPVYIRDKLKLVKDVHEINTRSRAHNLILPKFKKSFGQRTFSYSAASIWNELPNAIKELNSVNSFVKELKLITV